MSDAAPSKELLDLARRNTRGEVSPRRHQASRARVLDQLGQRKSSKSGTAFAIGFLVLGGGGVFAGVKSLQFSHHPASDMSINVAQPSPSAEEHPTPATRSTQSPSDDEEGVKLQVSQEKATIFWDDKKQPENPSTFRFKPDGKVHRVRAEAPGYAPKTQLVIMDSRYVLVELDLQPLPVTLGPITSTSSVIDADEITEGLRDAFQNCYTTALSSDTPTPPGKATVALQVAENGKVDSSDVVDKEGLNAPVTTCLAAAAADLHFRVTGRGFVKIPLVFRAK